MVVLGFLSIAPMPSICLGAASGTDTSRVGRTQREHLGNICAGCTTGEGACCLLGGLRLDRPNHLASAQRRLDSAKRELSRRKPSSSAPTASELV